MPDLASNFPASLRERAAFARLAGPFQDIPALLAHPQAGWDQPGASPRPAPVCIWLHGRTANKELDPGRYLRWLRAEGGGMAACAVDLPGHGERADPQRQLPERSLEGVEQAAAEIDAIVSALAEPRFNSAFDTTRLAIGGMSMGGMVALLRLCRPHRFRCAAVEATTGCFEGFQGRPFYIEPRVRRAEAIRHINDPEPDGWRPIPLLALHSEADRWIPVAAMRTFIDALRERYTRLGADPAVIRLHTWPETGAPEEHIGFGRVSNEAKNLQTEFLARWLGTG